MLLVTAYIGDRLRQRGLIVIFLASVTLCGMIRKYWNGAIVTPFPTLAIAYLHVYLNSGTPLVFQ